MQVSAGCCSREHFKDLENSVLFFMQFFDFVHHIVDVSGVETREQVLFPL